jgi:hypothetical protein
MIARRFAVLAFSAAIGFGIALHELPRQHTVPLATTATGATTAAVAPAVH